MKYNDQNALDAAIEKIVRKKVQYYYTDWKNYDRPKYMCCKASSQRTDKELVLIARSCGTYLLRKSDIRDNKYVRAIYEYFADQESADYYDIDLLNLTVKKAKAS